MRSGYKAHEVEILLGISIDVQKDWQKRMAAQGLRRLGSGNGHREYTLLDLCFLKLIDILKARGVPLSLALPGCLFEAIDIDQPHFKHPATANLRSRIARVFASQIVGYQVDSDVMLYLPESGAQQILFTWFLSTRLGADGKSIAGADPDVTTASVFEHMGNADNVVAINLTRMTERLIQHIRDHGESLLAFADALPAVIEAMHDKS